MNQLHKTFPITFLLCLLLSGGLAQDSLEFDRLSIAIRGKALGGAILEDLYFRTATLGAEVTFKKRHSFGVDLNISRSESETDDPDPCELYGHFLRRRYVYTDYKLDWILRESHSIYLNIYGKVGSYAEWNKAYENDKSTQNLDFIPSNANGYFKEVGIGLGVKGYFSAKRRFGIDFSINFARRQEVYDEEIFDTGSYQLGENVIDVYNLPFLKLNLFYVVKRIHAY